MARLIASLLVISSLVLGSSLVVSSCKMSDPAKHCEQSPTLEECRSCCKKAGRNGEAWVDGDCECNEQ